MEREANYVAVGAFILLVLGMAIGFVLWYTDANDGRDYELYEIYFAGSVSGLDRGSPVRYLGVDVGRVRRLGIDPQQREPRRRRRRDRQHRADLLGDAREPRPARRDRPAVRQSQGSARDRQDAASCAQGKRYPVIESVASDFDMFLASLPEMMGRANALLERVGARVLR